MKKQSFAKETSFPTNTVWRIYHRKNLGNTPSGKELHAVLRALFPGIQIQMSDFTPFSHIQLFQVPIKEFVPNIDEPLAKVLEESGERLNLRPKIVCTRGHEWRAYAMLPA